MAEFYYTPESPTYLEPEVHFVNLSEYANTYNWTFAGYDPSVIKSPYIVFNGADANDTIEACLVASNEIGCADTACQIIVFQEAFAVYVPNTFTPDGDKFNQYFTPVLPPDIEVEDYEFLIFNRWGQLVFRADIPNVGWDGSYRKNEISQDGVYTWKLVVKDAKTNQKYNYVGHVTILR